LDHEKPDILTIEAILKGDKNAFKFLYEKYRRRYMLTCLRYIKSRANAEDVLQDGFIAIFKNLSQFDSTKGEFYTWSNRIMINTCLQKLRKKSFSNVFEDIMEFSQKISIAENAIANLSLQEVTAVIQRLPKGYRTVFNMYMIDGYSHKDISKSLNISESTSKSQLLRAKKLLRTKLDTLSFSYLESYA